MKLLCFLLFYIPWLHFSYGTKEDDYRKSSNEVASGKGNAPSISKGSVDCKTKLLQNVQKNQNMKCPQKIKHVVPPTFDKDKENIHLMTVPIYKEIPACAKDSKSKIEKPNEKSDSVEVNKQKNRTAQKKTSKSTSKQSESSKNLNIKKEHSSSGSGTTTDNNVSKSELLKNSNINKTSNGQRSLMERISFDGSEEDDEELNVIGLGRSKSFTSIPLHSESNEKLAELAKEDEPEDFNKLLLKREDGAVKVIRSGGNSRRANKYHRLTHLSPLVKCRIYAFTCILLFSLCILILCYIIINSTITKKYSNLTTSIHNTSDFTIA